MCPAGRNLIRGYGSHPHFHDSRLSDRRATTLRFRCTQITGESSRRCVGGGVCIDVDGGGGGEFGLRARRNFACTMSSSITTRIQPTLRCISEGANRAQTPSPRALRTSTSVQLYKLCASATAGFGRQGWGARLSSRRPLVVAASSPESQTYHRCCAPECTTRQANVGGAEEGR